jgi:hypothetical protein
MELPVAVALSLLAATVEMAGPVMTLPALRWALRAAPAVPAVMAAITARVAPVVSAGTGPPAVTADSVATAVWAGRSPETVVMAVTAAQAAPALTEQPAPTALTPQ